MATTIVWGQISLQKCIIHEIAEESVFTDDKMILRYRKYTIRFSAYLQAGMNAFQMANDQRGSLLYNGATPTLTAQAVFAWMGRPRQYFRLDMDDQALLEVPVNEPASRADAMMGPICRNITVNEVRGAPGFNNFAPGVGGYFFITGVFEVCIDVGQNFAGQTADYLIQGWHWNCVNDVNGDTLRTTRTTQMVIHLNPQNRFIGNVIPDIPEVDIVQIAAFCAVPLRFKRRRCRVEMLTSQVDMMLLFVDEEQPLNIGGASAATTFKPSHHYNVGWPVGKDKEGTMTSGLVIQIEANYNELDEIEVPGRPDDHGGRTTKEAVIQQCFEWILKFSHAKRGNQGMFSFYSDISVGIDYGNAMILVVAKIALLNFNKGNPGNIAGTEGLPFGLEAFRVNDDFSLFDQSEAQIFYLDDEELTQIPETVGGVPLKFALKNPALEAGILGSWFGGVLYRILQPSGNTPNQDRLQPDGFTHFCPPNAIIGPNTPGDLLGPYNPAPTAIEVEFEVVPSFNFENPSGNNLYSDGVQGYESTWMSTRYRTNSGDATLPLGGVMPGGTTTPKPSRVQVTLHEKVTDKAVHWGIQSIGAVQPKYPSINTGDPKDVYIRSDIKPAACVPVAGATGSISSMEVNMFAWTITGTYYYERLEKREPGDRLTLGRISTRNPGSIDAYATADAEDGRLPGV